MPVKRSRPLQNKKLKEMFKLPNDCKKGGLTERNHIKNRILPFISFTNEVE